MQKNKRLPTSDKNDFSTHKPTGRASFGFSSSNKKNISKNTQSFWNKLSGNLSSFLPKPDFISAKKTDQAKNQLEGFLLALKNSNCSPSTIRNYRSDIKQFFEFAGGGKIDSILTKPKLISFATYQAKKGLKPASINRKLSAIIQMSFWVAKRGFRVNVNSSWLKEIGEKANTRNFDLPTNNLSYSSQTENPNYHLKSYLHSLGVTGNSRSTIRNYRSDINQFIDFVTKGRNQIDSLEQILTKPKLKAFIKYQQAKGLKLASIDRKLSSITQFGLWAKKRNLAPDVDQNWPLILSSKNIEDNLNDNPRILSTKEIGKTPSLSNQKIRNIFSKPENKIKKADSPSSPGEFFNSKLNILSALNFGILLLFVAGLGYFGYQQFSKTNAPLAYPSTLTRPERILSFQGRLTDTGQNPITTSTDMSYRLYNSNSGGTLLWNSSNCSVDPDQDGIFAVNLGAGTGGGSDTADCGSEISDGVFTENANVWLEVEIATETLTPRQPIRTVAYAVNSETVQGYPATASAVENTILTMNSSGEVVLGNTNPKIKATGDSFTLEGASMTLQTPSGSNTDITLSAGNDIIFDAGGIGGTGNIAALDFLHAPGATLSANYAGGTALVLRGGPGGTGNITEWQDNAGAALSVVDESGNVGIGTSDPTAMLEIAQNSDVKGIQITGFDDRSNSNFHFYIDSFGTTQGQATNKLKFASGGGGNLEFIGNNNITFDVDGASGQFQVRDDSNTPLFIIEQTTGNVGIGTTSPSQKLDVLGSIRLGTAGAGNVLGTSAGAAPTGDLYWGSRVVCDDTGNCGTTGMPSGTSGQTIRHNGTDWISTNLLYNTGVNVGIGTTNPLFKLAVDGDIAALNGSNIWLKGGGSLGLENSSGNNAAYISNYGASGVSSLNIADSLYVLEAGNVGIGTTAPDEKLHVEGNIKLSNGQYVVGTGYKRDIPSSSGEQAVGRYYDVAQLYLHELAGFVEMKLTIDGSAVGQSYDFVFAPSYNFNEYAGSTAWHLLSPIRKFERNVNIPDEFGIAVQWASGHNFNVRVIKTEQGGAYATNTRDIKIVIKDPTGGHYTVTEQTGTGTMSVPTDIIYGGAHYNVNTGNLGIGTTAPEARLDVSGGDIILDNNEYISFRNTSGAKRDVLTLNSSNKVYIDNPTGGHINLNGSMYVERSNGNVGIGTDTPSEVLDIIGNIEFSGSLEPGGLPGAIGEVLVSQGAGVAPIWSASVPASSLAWDDLTDPDANLSLSMNTYTTGFNYATGTGANNLFSFTTDASANGTGSLVNIQTGVGATVDPFRVRTGATEALMVDSAGNVGIGIITPSEKLEVAGNVRLPNNGIIYLWKDHNSNFLDYNTWQMNTSAEVEIKNLGTGDISLETGTGDILLQPAGNVGIGTTAPNNLLSLESTLPILQLQGSADNQFESGRIRFTESGSNPYLGGFAHYDGSANVFNIGVNNGTVVGNDVNAISIERGTSYVGIGTTDPNYKLDVAGTINIVNGYSEPTSESGFRLKFSDNGGINNDVGIGVSGALGSEDLWLNTNPNQNIRFMFGTNGEKVTFEGSGNVGIGTTAPAQKLEIKGSAYGDAILRLDNSVHTWDIEAGQTGYSSQALSFYHDGNQQLRIMPDGSNGIVLNSTKFRFANGNVGVGVDPSYKLDVSGEANFTDAIRVAGNAGTSGYFLTSSAGGANTWTDPDTITGAGLWDNTLNVFHPKDELAGVVDLTLGGDSTASANIHLQSNGQAYFGGNVGVGTSSPNNRFEVATTFAGSIRQDAVISNLGTTNGTGQRLGFRMRNSTDSTDIMAYIGGITIDSINRDSALVFQTMDNGGTSEAMRIDQVGNVGIGTTTPGAKLEISQNSNTSPALYVTQAGTSGGKGLRVDLADGGQSGTDRYALWLRTQSTGTPIEAMFVSGTGNIGLGTTTPSSTLHIYDTAAGAAATTTDDNLVLEDNGLNYINFLSPTNQISGLVFSDATRGRGQITYNHSNDSLRFVTAGVQNVTIDSNGNVGIGTTSPSQNLEVSGTGIRITGDPAILKFDDAGGGEDSYFITDNSKIYIGKTLTPSGANDLIGIDLNSGNVGIGSTSPTAGLEIKQGTATSSSLKIQNPHASATSYYTTFINNWADQSFSINQGGTNILKTYGFQDADELAIGVAGYEESIYIDTIGNIGIGTTTPGNKLEVTGNIEYGNNLLISGGSFKNYQNLASRSDGSHTGAVVVNTNYPWNDNCMFDATVDIYYYNSNATYSVKFGGYMYTNNSFVNKGYESTSKMKNQIRFARNSNTDTMAFIIGDEADINYINARVSEFNMGTACTKNDAHADGWSISEISDLAASGYDYITSVGETTVLSGLVNQTSIADNYFTGNLGIGTTTPSEKLDVSGNIEFSGSLEPAGLPGTSGQILVSQGAGVAPIWSNSVPASSLAWDDLIAPDANLSLNMSTYTTGFNYATGTGTNNLFSFTTDASANGTGALVNIQTGTGSTVTPLRIRAGTTESLIVNSSGNVGIGTTTTNSRLSLDGDIELTTNGQFEKVMNNNMAVIAYPEGAFYQTATSPITGAIEITLPVLGPTDMIKMTVDVYDYNIDESVTLLISGYTYSSTNWTNTSVQIIGSQTDKAYTVRFGDDGVNSKIWIGELGSTWSYPQVVVKDVMLGFLSNIADWQGAWNIDFEATAFDTVDRTQSGAGNFPQASNADTLDDISSGSFLRSDVSDNYTSGTLTFDSGTVLGVSSGSTLDVNGNLSIADTDIALDGASTNLNATGNFSINTDDLFVQKSDGNVGIGTTSAVGKLHVQGGTVGITLRNTGAADSLMQLCSAGGCNYIAAGASNGYLHLGGSPTAVGGSSPTLTVRPNNSNVGIGSVSPSEKLDVNGNILASNNGNVYAHGNMYTGYMYLGSYSSSALLSTGDANEDLTIDPNGTGNIYLVPDGTDGNVGIGTISPTNKLDVFGDARATNLISASGGIGSYQNLLTWSEDFSNTNWSAYFIKPGITTGITDPFGGTNATSFASAGSNYSGILQGGTLTSGNTYTASVWLRAASGTLNVSYGLSDSYMTAATIDTTWRKYTYTATPSSNQTRKFQIYENVAGNTAWEIAFPQTEESSSPRTYAKTEGTAITTRVAGLTTGELYVDNSTGNVGIGTTTPGAKLDVAGNIRITSGSDLYTYSGASYSPTLGNRSYTEDNYVTDAQTLTASVDALDQAVYDISTGAGGLWTDGGNTTYLTSLTDDFAIGGTGLASPFSVDESAQTVRIGQGSGVNGQLNMYASDGDTGNITYNTNDGWDFSGGHIAMGANASVSSTRVLVLDEHYSTDANTYQLYSATLITSPTLTADRTSRGAYFTLTNNKTENIGSGFDSNATGIEALTSTGGTSTFRINRGVYGQARNDSTAASDLGNLYGVEGLAYQNAISGTVVNATGLRGLVQGDISAGSTSTITTAYGNYNQIYAYNSDITSNAYGTFNRVRTVSTYDGSITNAYGSYDEVYVDSYNGGDITTGTAGYFTTSRRATANLMTTSYGIHVNANSGVTTYGARLVVDDTAPTTNYGLQIDAKNATGTTAGTGSFGIYGIDGDWILDADGSGESGGLNGTNAGGDLILGEGQDLELYHDGTNSYIMNNTGDLYIGDSGADDVILSSNGGNVGINTNSPAYKLDVNGTSRFTDDIRIDPGKNINFYDHNGTFPTADGGFTWDLNDDKAKIYAQQPSSDRIDFVFKIEDNVGSTDRFLYWIDSYTGETDDAYPLLMDGSKTVFNYPTVFGTGTSKDVDFYIMGNGKSSISSAYFFGDAANERVGVGTTTPAYSLDVVSGDAIAASFNGRVIGSDAVGTNEFVTLSQLTGGTGQYWSKSGSNLSPTTSGDDLYLRSGEVLGVNYDPTSISGGVAAFGGNVGIGTSSPSFNDISTGIPQLHTYNAGTSGLFVPIARFSAGADADNTGATVVINHSNDRGLTLSGGRGTGDQPVGYIGLSGTSGQIVNHISLVSQSGGNPTTAYIGIGSTTPGNLLDINTTSTTSGIAFDNQEALTGYSGDTWLRLNQNNQWSSGVYTPGHLRVDGEIRAGSSDYGAYSIQSDNDLYVNDFSALIGGVNIGGSSDPGTGNLVMSGQIDANGTGTHDIAGTLNLSGNNLTSSGVLTINSNGSTDSYINFSDDAIHNAWIGTDYGTNSYNNIANISNTLIRADEKYTVTMNNGCDSGSIANIFDGDTSTHCQITDASPNEIITIMFNGVEHYWNGLEFHWNFSRGTDTLLVERLRDTDAGTNGTCDGGADEVWETVAHTSVTNYVDRTDGIGNYICGIRATVSGTPDTAGDTRFAEIKGFQFYQPESEDLYFDVTGGIIYGKTTIGTTSTNRDLIVQGEIGIGSITPAYSLDVVSSDAIAGRFDGRVKGVSAVSSDEFVTLAQLTGGTGQYWSKSGTNLSPTTAGDDIYLPSSSILGVSYDPSTISGGVAAFNGNVGIGTSSPETNLHIKNSASGYTPTNVSGLFIENNGNSQGYYVFQTATSGGGKSFSITNNGHVGIGTTTPSELLTIDSTSDPTLLIGDSTTGNAVNAGKIAFTESSGEQFYIRHDGSANKLHIGTSTVGDSGFTMERVSGEIGIGTSSPGAPLDMYLNNTNTVTPGLRVQQDGTGDASTVYLLTGVRNWATGVDNSDSDKFKIGMSSDLTTNNYLTIDIAGNVGIGTTAPAAQLHSYDSNTLGSTAGNSQIISRIAGSSSNNFMQNQWLYRDSAGSDWTTTRLHDGISVDSSFLTPGTDTRVWWERDPSNNIQSWGNTTSTYMTLNSTGLAITNDLTVSGNDITLGNGSTISNATDTDLNITGDGNIYMRGSGSGSFFDVGTATGGANNTHFNYGANDDIYLSYGTSGNVYNRSGATTRSQLSSSGNYAISGAIRTGSASVTSYNRFGSGGTANYATDNASDVYIEDELEVDGSICLGNDCISSWGTAGIDTTDNLLYNGDFEEGTEGWTGLDSAPTGGYAGNLTGEAVGSSTVRNDEYIPVDPKNDVFQLEAYFKKSVNGTTPGIMYFGYMAYDENKTVITTAPCGTYCYFAASGYTFPDNNWHKFSATTTGEGTSYPNFPVGTKFIRVLVLINYSGSADTVTQMDHVTLKRINHGPLFVGENFASTNRVDRQQVTKLWTTSSDDFIIEPPAGGGVGIGTTDPGSYLLNVQGTTKIDSDDSTGALQIARISNPDQALYLRGGNGSGEGRVAAEYSLELRSGLSANTAYDVTLSTAAGEGLRVDASAGNNIGINDTTPDFKLDLDGDFMADTDSGNQKFYISRAGATTETLSIHVDGANVIFASEQDENSGSAGGFTFQMDDDGTAAPIFRIEEKSGTDLFRVDTNSYAYAKRFSDRDNPTLYYLEPASGNSLFTAGNVGIGVPATIGTKHKLEIARSADNYAASLNTVTLNATGTSIASRATSTVQDIMILRQPNTAGGSKGSTFGMGLSFWEDPGNNYPRTRVDFKTTGRTTDDPDPTNTIMSLRDDGLVGIGTTAPDTNLHIYTAASGAGSMGTEGQIIEGNSDVMLEFATPNDALNSIYFTDPQASGRGNITYDHATDELIFGATGINTMYLKNGNVGIGVSGPTDKLHIGAAGGIRLTNSELANVTDASGVLYFDENYYGSGEAGYPHFTGNGGGIAFKNEDGWGALVSTTNMQWLDMNLNSLHVGGTSDPGTDNVIIDGNVGIGTTSLTNKLNVNGHISLKGGDRQIDIETGYLDIRPTDSTYGIILRDFTGSTTIWSTFKTVNAATDYLYLGMNSTSTNEGIIISDNGNIGISSVTPGAKLDIVGINDTSSARITLDQGSGSNNYKSIGLEVDITSTGGANENDPIGVDASAIGDGWGAYPIGVKGYAENYWSYRNNNAIGVLGEARVTDSDYSTSSGDYNIIGVKGIAHESISGSPRLVGVYGGIVGDTTRGFAGYFDGRGYFSGNLGIGTTAPGQKLDISGGSVVIDANSGSNANAYEVNRGGVDYPILWMNSDVTYLGTPFNNSVIVQTNNTVRMTVNNNGNVGIGAPNPGDKVVVQDGTVKINSPGTEGFLLNKTTDSCMGGGGSDDVWTRFTTACNSFTYSSVAVGPFWANGATRFDLAELTAVRESDNLIAGDIVMADPNKDTQLTRNIGAYNASVFGIVSDVLSAAMVIGGKGPENYQNGDRSELPIALAGRVLVKMTSENGFIQRGDPVTTSDIPGYGMKMDKAGPTIGKSMDKFDPTQMTCQSVSSENDINWKSFTENSIPKNECYILPDGTHLTRITVFVSTGWYDPDMTLTETGSINIIKDVSNNYSITKEGKTYDRIGAFAELITANIRAGLTTTQELIVNSTATISDLVVSGTTTLQDLSVDSITIQGVSITDFIASMIADNNSIVTNQSATTFDTQDLNTANLTATGSSQLQELTATDTTLDDLTVSNRTQLADLIAQEATISGTTRLGDLIVDQNTTIAGDTTISGNATISGSLTATGTSLLGDLMADSASISGDATISGSLDTININATNGRLDYLESQVAQFEDIQAQTAQIVTATVSGTLYADVIANFDEKVAAAFNQPTLLGTLMGIDPVDPLANFDMVATSSADLDLKLADLNIAANDVVITPSAAFINEYLRVNGNGYISGQLGVEQELHVGDGMAISTGEIAYSPGPGSPDYTSPYFKIQPSGQGTLSLMAGLMILTDNGQITINGDLKIAGALDVNGSVSIKDTLLTNLIAPLDPDKAIQLQLAQTATDSADVTETRFEIIDELGSPVATISASGKAEFAGGLGITSEIIEATTSGDLVAKKTAGKATLLGGQVEVVIKSELITDDTLIYVTPLGSTGNQVLYVKSQITEDPETAMKEGQFVVGLDASPASNVEFNWWLVN